MAIRLIGIAGGSGAGKSSVCYQLVDKYPDKFEVVNLDDYQKKKTVPNLPKVKGKINWDHPDIIDWKKLINDLNSLKSGKSVEIDVWSHRSIPDYALHGQMKPRIIYPKPILLVEGYLALYNPNLNKLYEKKFYLDIDEKTRNARRDKSDVIDDPDYVNEVLIPMFKKYVEPTRATADEVIDVSNLSVTEVADYIFKTI